MKNLPAMHNPQEMQFPSLGWEDPLEEEMATCSSILAGESHGQRSLEGYSPRGPKELDRIEHPCTHTLGCGLCVKKAERQRIDALELWCFGKTLESPLDCKEIQSVHPKGDQSWVFIERCISRWASRHLEAL